MTYFQFYKSVQITKTDKISGLVLYPLGDLIAQLILGDIDFFRLLFVALLGRFIYAIEIPKWFSFLALWRQENKPSKYFAFLWIKKENKYLFNWFGKTIGATLWFHPLWIARHMFVLELTNILYGKTDGLSFIQTSIELGAISYIGQFPVALVANYIIICKLSEKSRFFWSSVFSGLLAIYYAVGKVYF